MYYGEFFSVYLNVSFLNYLTGVRFKVITAVLIKVQVLKMWHGLLRLLERKGEVPTVLQISGTTPPLTHHIPEDLNLLLDRYLLNLVLDVHTKKLSGEFNFGVYHYNITSTFHWAHTKIKFSQVRLIHSEKWKVKENMTSSQPITHTSDIFLHEEYKFN